MILNKIYTLFTYMKYSYLVILCLVLCVCAGGCLSTQEQSGGMEPSFNNFVDDEGYYEEKVSYGESQYATAPDSATLPGAGSITEQQLIKRGSVNLEVESVSDSLETLKDIAESRGGFLSSSTFSRGSSDRLSATVTVRVPGSAFDGTISEIRELGKLLSESLNLQDVTEEYVDLTAQKEAKTHQLEQYNRIIEKAESVEDILKVQVEIERVQVELDRLEARLRYLENRVDLATITVYLQEPAPIGGDTGHSFIRAINQGIEGFLVMIDSLIILFITTLPLIILGLLGFGLYRWRKQRKAATGQSKEGDKV